MRIASALVALLIAAVVAGCEDGPAPPAAGTPTVEATPDAVATATAPAAAASTPTPTPQPSPTQTETPSPTSTPSPTPATVPSPTLTPAPTTVPLPTREDLGIREVAAAEAFAAVGLTHVRYEAGEEVSADRGLYLLDVETGGVEGWTCQRGDCPRFYLSPSNRFLSFAGYLHDRQTGRTYADVGVRVVKAGRPVLAGELTGWGTGPSERLLIQPTADGFSRYAVLNSSLHLLAQRDAIPGGSVEARHGSYVAAFDNKHLRMASLEPSSDPAGAELIEPALPQDILWPDDPWTPEIDAGRDAVALIVPGEAGSVRIIRYGWDGTLLSDISIPHLVDDGYIKMSPDGNLVAGSTRGMAISIFHVATGAEILRIPGATARVPGSYIIPSG